MAERAPSQVGSRILVELQNVARLSFNELSRWVDLFAPAAADRARRLQATGVSTPVDLARAGRGVRAIVDGTATDRRACSGTPRALSWPEVQTMHRVAGVTAECCWSWPRTFRPSRRCSTAADPWDVHQHHGAGRPPAVERSPATGSDRPRAGQQAHRTCRHDGQSWRLRTSRLRADPWRAKTRIGESVGESVAAFTMLR